MNDIDVNRVLTQIRALSQQAAQRPAANAIQPAASQSQAGGFADAVKGALTKASVAEDKAAQVARAFELGDPSADLAKVMIAQAQAQVSFRSVSEVRNRLVSAYQEIMNMPL